MFAAAQLTCSLHYQAGGGARGGGARLTDVSWVSSLYQYSEPVAASTAFCQAKQMLEKQHCHQVLHMCQTRRQDVQDRRECKHQIVCTICDIWLGRQ